MIVKTTKTWETVFFKATKNGVTAVVELSINYQTKDYTLCTNYEESVSFKNNSIEMATLKVEALKVAVKYLSNIL